MTLSIPLLESSKKSSSLALCVLLGTLTACGSPQPAEPSLPEKAEMAASLPFDVDEVIQRARRTPSVMASPSAFEVSPETPLYAEFYTQHQVTPAVAAGNGLYFVVWTEFYPSTPQQPVIKGVRVRASDGALLDAAPINVRPNPYTVYTPMGDPSVAFDGTNFLVVFTEYRQSNISPYLRTMGVLVRASDGAVLTPYGLVLSTGSRETSRPSVAFDGTNYLAVWEGWTIPQNGSSSTYLLHGARVRPSGELVDTTAFPIAPNGYNARLAYGGGSYLAAWSEGSSGPIRVTRFFPGVAQPIASLTLAGSGGSTPALAFDGSNFLVVWNEAGGVLKGKRVSISPWRVLDDTALTLGAEAVSPATVSFDTSSFRISYQGTRGGARKLISIRVNSSGEVTPGAEQILSDLHPSSGEERPSVASLGTAQNLVAYKQYDPALGRTRIKVRRFSDLQAAPCATGTPALVLQGSAELTLECGAGTYTDPGARAFDGCGGPLQVHAYNTGSDASGPGPNLSVEGSYSVSYAAWDATGSVTASRTVHVDDRTAPVLVLKGAAHQTHTCGSQWADPGVEATDACYGNLAHTVWRTGEVNGWAEGTYTVTYSLTDSGGNAAPPVTRTVEVVDCPW
ncbi:uncharacterized protein STAUR_5355 [Stigmatella aurantiaca DW4/3-1]|nr:uncharacterized protein STAUR_5355 [Stigmatella aurantiaca DW4/3-1]